MATLTVSRSAAASNRDDRASKRKKEQRTDIWSNLLRQTRDAQARNRSQAVHHRSLILCGGSTEDQRAFFQGISRPPPPQPPSRNQDRRQQRQKGELRLSNKYAYGYGYVSLFSPPQQSGTGVQVLGAEAEEAAKIELHTIPDPERQYVGTLRRLFQNEPSAKPASDDLEFDDNANDEAENTEKPKPAVFCLLSWKEPWKFMDHLRAWLQLLAQALLPAEQLATDPLDVIKDAQIKLTVVVQHVESQEELFREGYKEEDFDFISQCLRTAILPLHPFSSLVYMSSTVPPQPPGSSLSELQRVVYASLALDLAVLSPKLPRSGDGNKKEELGPKHEFMDRMAIVIPAGWDSPAFIRTLSESFSPEEILNTWFSDLQPVQEQNAPSQTEAEQSETPSKDEKHPNSATEVYASSPILESADDSAFDPPISPSKAAPSAIRAYQARILDPQAHRAPRPPQIEVTTKHDQKFLAEMRAHLQELETHDREREARATSSGVSSTSLSASRVVGMPAGEQTGALNDLGDMSFNVGGVSYDAISAEAALDRLRRTSQQQQQQQQPQPSQPSLGPDLVSPITAARTSTPKPRINREASDSTRLTGSTGRETPATTPSSATFPKSVNDAKDLPRDKLEQYFHSLMVKGGGSPASSRDGTPSRRKE